MPSEVAEAALQLVQIMDEIEDLSRGPPQPPAERARRNKLYGALAEARWAATDRLREALSREGLYPEGKSLPMLDKHSGDGVG